MKYANLTTIVQLKDKPVKIHALCTGTVAVKRNFRTKKGWGEMAKINILIDSQYTEYMPIWVWVIEHPEGLMVIDTGEIAAIENQAEYLAGESSFMRYFFRHGAKFQVSAKDELDHQFDSIHLKPEDVQLVVLTHLHLDHTDGLKFFKGSEIIVSELEHQHPNGNMPGTYPTWFKPNPVRFEKNRIDVFNEAYPITDSEDLMYVPTPGHTVGHSSVIFKTDEFDILFGGDISYNQEQIINHELAGINADYSKSKRTYNNLNSYGDKFKTIYLPTHDADSAIRLKDRVFLM